MEEEKYIQPETLYDYQLILPHPTKAQLLFLAGENGWALPAWKTRKLEYWQVIQPLNEAIKSLFGVEATILRLIYDAVEPTNNYFLRLYELESRNNPEEWKLPAGARWVGSEELDGLNLDRPELRSFLRDWFEEAENGTSSIRRPWARPGWFAGASDWIKSQLEVMKIKVLSPVEQLRTWERSCVLRINTEVGMIYFKAVPAWFSQEIGVAVTLVKDFPENMPQILAVDEEKHWILTLDFGGELLARVPQLERWKVMVRRLAALQLHSSRHQDEFRRLNCPYRPLSVLAGQIDAFLADLNVYTRNRWVSLTPDEILRLQKMAPRLKEWCDTLAGYNLPVALEHGDLWPANIAATDRDYIFFDWSDCSLSHPFFSLLLLFTGEDAGDEAIKKARQEDPAWIDKIKQFYLEEWREYGSPEQLQPALDLALKLAPLHQALNYHYFILPRMEARWEMESMVPFYLRMLLTQKFN